MRSRNRKLLLLQFWIPIASLVNLTLLLYTLFLPLQKMAVFLSDIYKTENHLIHFNFLEY